MPKTIIKVTRAKAEGNGVEIVMRLRLAEGDPEAKDLFVAIATFVKQILAPDEVEEFLKELREQWKKMQKGASKANV